MTKMNTHELTRKLEGLNDLQSILKENSSNFIAQPLCDALSDLLEKKGITRAQAIKRSMINTIYGQQIFAGTKTPSRDKLILIIFGLGLDLQEANALLKQQGYPCLYSRRERDAVIMYGLLHSLSLLDTNTLLFENDLETLL